MHFSKKFIKKKHQILINNKSFRPNYMETPYLVPKVPHVNLISSKSKWSTSISFQKLQTTNLTVENPRNNPV